MLGGAEGEGEDGIVSPNNRTLERPQPIHDLPHVQAGTLTELKDAYVAGNTGRVNGVGGLELLNESVHFGHSCVVAGHDARIAERWEARTLPAKL